MSRNNTGNPIDSKAYADFEDNVKNLDQAVNAEQDTFQDRLGKSRLTWAGIEKAGTGNPAIAVDAAARAVAAAGRAEAAEAMVDAANIQGYVAQAEAARDLAVAASGRYVDTPAGLAATVDGQEFLVSTDDPQKFIVYLNDSGVAVETGIFVVSDGAEARALSNALRSEISSPNLLSYSEVVFRAPTDLIDSVGEQTVVDGVSSLEIMGTGSNPARCRWSVHAENFKSGVISVYVVVRSRNGSSGQNGSFRIIQRDSSGGIILETEVDGGAVNANLMGPSSDPVALRGSAAVAAGAVSVDMDLRMFGEGRQFIVQSPSISDGGVPEFRKPKDYGAINNERLMRVSVGADPVELEMSVQPDQVGGGFRITPLTPGEGSASLLNIATSGVGSSSVAAFKLADGLRSGETVLMSVTVGSVTSNPSFGILFGDSGNLRGFGLRSNRQLLILNWPNATGAVDSTSPAPPAYSAGDRITMEARLLGGVPGNYTVRYHVVFEETGTRYGPYDVPGITSLSGIWFGTRAHQEGLQLMMTRHRMPGYLSEWISDYGGDNAQSLVYVSPTGNDLGGGTQADPFGTIARAVSALPNGGIVELFGGEYRETISVHNPHSIWIRSRRKERAYILGSDQLVVTKTPGMTQVYQAPLADKPVGMGGSRGQPLIAEWGTPSKPIPQGDRHPLQRNRSHRLPYTEMFEAGSLAELDTPAGLGKWWWESGTIYLVATDGGDATAKRYEARAREALTHSLGCIRLSRLSIFFSSNHGVRLGGALAVTEDVSVFGSHHNGFAHMSGIWHSLRDESAGNGNDGFNGTVSDWSGADDADRITAILHDPYGHDNADDGTSYHYRGDQTIHGGLFEYNNKADVVHVTGASVTCYGTVARGSANGFYAGTAPADDDAREVTSLRCVQTKAIGNQYSYRATAGTVLECFNTLAVDPSVRGYAQSDDGVLEAIDCRFIGEAGKEKEGIVTVINSTLLE